MKIKAARIAPVLLAVGLWTTGNSLMSHLPARADEPDQVASNDDPNNPTCVGHPYYTEATNCKLNRRGLPIGSCTVTTGVTSYVCQPGDTGATTPGENGLGMPIRQVIGGNCTTTFKVAKTAKKYRTPCQVDPTVPGHIGCLTNGNSGIYIGKTSVTSSNCTDNSGLSALNEPVQHPLKKNVILLAKGTSKMGRVSL